MRLDELFEAVVDVAIQGRVPGSPGSMGLMRSRADYGHTIKSPLAVEKGAVDALSALLPDQDNPEHAIDIVCQNFKMEPEHLKKIFYQQKKINPAQFAHLKKEQLKNAPMKI
jgi:AraC-like DNA-binding protein